MKSINSISSQIRDSVLSKNIGKYNMVKSVLSIPIGLPNEIYNENTFLKNSLTENGLLEFTNSTEFILNNGELSTTLSLNNVNFRDNEAFYVDYSTKEQKYSYLEDKRYNDPNNTNWFSKAFDISSGLILGDSVGIGLNSNGIALESTSLDIYTSIAGRLANLALNNETNIGKIGLKNIGFQLGNTVTNKINSNIRLLKYLEKPIGFYDYIDILESEKNQSLPISGSVLGLSDKIIPIYFYSELKKDKTIEYVNAGDISTINEFTWNNKSNETNTFIDSNGYEIPLNVATTSPQSILYKTQKMFQSGRIESLITESGRIESNGDKDVSVSNRQSRGRNLTKTRNGLDFCRVWTVKNKYDKLSSLIRPFSDVQLKDNMDSTLNEIRPGSRVLNEFGVLDKNGFVKIAPYKTDIINFNSYDKIRETKKYMFSIENLAWKDSIDSLIKGTSQEGPNGGRIMWFPPYDISFNETTSVNWNSETFIGRGEPVYTYVNTDRNGTLSFKLIVDHPSIINLYKKNKENGVDINEDDYLKFFAGCDVLDLGKNEEEVIDEPEITPEPEEVIAKPTKKVSFKVYFPNNYSGVNDKYEDALKYLMYGAMCSSIGGNGYENEPGENIIIEGGTKYDWKGLTPYNATVPCYDGKYYYRVDSSENLSTMQYKDRRSFGLNSSKHDANDPNAYSFRDAYINIQNPVEIDSIEFMKNYSKLEYVNQTIIVNNLKIELDTLENENKINPDSVEILNDYNGKLSEYNSALNILITKEDDFNKKNPSGFIYVSMLSYDDNGKIVSSKNNAALSMIQSNWNTYNQKYRDLILLLKKMLDYKYIYDTTGNNFTEYTDSIIKYNSVKTLVDSTANMLINNLDSLINNNNTPTFNDFYQTLLDATDILVIGSSSKHGKESKNISLTKNRIDLIVNWLRSHNNSDIYKTESAYKEAEVLSTKDVSSKEAKLDRFVYVVINSGPTSLNVEGEVNKIGYTTGKEKVTTENKDNIVVEANSTALRKKVSMYNFNTKNKTTNDEATFFEKINENSIGEIIKGKLSEKIKYFHPAFHSMNPEGFNSRLTFLHQCTRQGPTSDFSNTNNDKRSATNMAFGRPPVCILRIGDFYNTKVIFDSLNIDFDPLVWDLNTEGIGVQPMIATVTMNFKFIGGSDLTGPIARLQNAISFNFFANTGVYDDRNDKIVKHSIDGNSEYEKLYNPYIYDEYKK